MLEKFQNYVGNLKNGGLAWLYSELGGVLGHWVGMIRQILSSSYTALNSKVRIWEAFVLKAVLLRTLLIAYGRNLIQNHLNIKENVLCHITESPRAVDFRQSWLQWFGDIVRPPEFSISFPLVWLYSGAGSLSRWISLRAQFISQLLSYPAWERVPLSWQV